MLLYLITDRRTLFSPEENFSESLAGERLLRLAQATALAGIDFFQLREKDLPTEAVYELTTRLARIFESTRTRLLVNDRFDVALSAGAHGVHLTTRSLSAREVKPLVPPDFLIGVSTHREEEIAQAVPYADFAVCGPVFDTPGKSTLGLAQFTVLARSTTLPMMALGGITVENIRQLGGSGAAGIAGIRLFSQGAFSNAESFVQYVHTLKSAF